MSGHSKWHSIKHKKAAVDAKRGKLFTKVIKELQIAARISGSDVNSNPRLRTAVQAAKDANMPKDTMERAIKKGAGELEGASFENITYEGYAPGGVALLVEVTTDNKNRAASEIRNTFSKSNCSIGTPGCVSYMFTRRGIIEVEGGTEDEVMEAALEAGATDVESFEGFHTVTTEPDEVQNVRDALEKKSIKVTSSGVKMVPTNYVKVEGKDAEGVHKLIGALEASDDVDEVYSNAEMDEAMAEAE